MRRPSEPDLQITGFLAPPPPFPKVLSFNFIVYSTCYYNTFILTSDILQSVESSVDELIQASDVAICLLREAVTKYARVSERATVLEDEKVILVREISAAEAKGKTLKEQLVLAKADVAATKGEAEFLKAELIAARAREEDLAASQGEVMRALAKRIFHSGEYGTLVGALNDVMTTCKVDVALDEVAKDYLDLEKEKYGYEAILDDEVLRTYAKVLMECTPAFPVVEAHASHRTLLSAHEVRSCNDDRDAKFEALLVDVER